MTEIILTMLDTSGIQPYIFGSNRLQENIGASEIVYRATTLWAFDALDKAGLKHNVRVKDRSVGEWAIDDARVLETDPNLDVEVVYAGGGNTMLMFRLPKQAKAFTKALTARMLRDAPGLTVAVRHIAMDWEGDKLPSKRNELLRELAAHKQSRLPSSPFLGLSVNAVCESTGLVAVRTTEGTVEVEGKEVRLKLSDEEETRLVSQEVVAKLGWRNLASKRLTEQVGESIRHANGYIYEFPSDIDKLGRIMGEESYVAVVHADGNRMGEHIAKMDEGIHWTNGIGRANRAYIEKVRTFSMAVEAASRQALQSIVTSICRNIGWNAEKKCNMVADEVPIEGHYLPFRPLVFGGDDVTFLCNAQLGLSVATAYLAEFEKAAAQHGLDDTHACAGVAMVKMHYPFARAYALSSQLCDSAKSYVRKEFPNQDQSALDWHFAISGLSGSLDAIRQREYTVSNGSLLMRPLRLREGNEQDGRYWENGIAKVIETFQQDVIWTKRRNKVKGLREPLRSGPLAVASYRRNYRLQPLPALLPGDTQHCENGWSGKQCVYFDAIELLDHHVPLR